MRAIALAAIAFATLAGLTGVPAEALRDAPRQAEADSDADGLSDDRETELGTCISRQDARPGLSCDTIADPRDTDGDGLMDGWEVLGYDASKYGVANGVTLPLAAWGADPRHKDLFIEIDYRRLDKTENDAGTDRRMTAQQARDLAAIFADRATVDVTLQNQHAAALGNPDGLPGIRIHLDIGREPERPEDATVFGDWGGHNAIDAIADPASAGGYRPVSPAVWRDEMNRSRHGIFHYVLGYTTGGGQCGFGVACEFNFESAVTGAHELGHNLGLDHGGPYEVLQPNCKPNYPSLMSYSGTGQFSDGGDLGVLNNHRLAETEAVAPNSALLDRLRDVYQYRVDPASGSVDWNRDNQFSPRGRFVRAYGNFAPGADCEGTRAGERPTGQVSDRSPAIVRADNHLWVFAVAPERALTFTLTPQPLACGNVDACPPLSFHLPAQASVGPVDGIDAVVATVAGRRLILLVGIRPDGTLFESWVELVNGRYVWGGPITIPGSPAAGEPSLAVSHDGQRVALAYKTRANTVAFRMRTTNGYQAEELITVTGPLTMTDKASPALAYTYLPSATSVTAVGGETLLAAVADASANGNFSFVTRRGAGLPWRRVTLSLEGVPRGISKRVTGRPGLAWVGDPRTTTSRGGGAGPGAATIGRLYLIYSFEIAPGFEGPAPHVRMVMTHVTSEGAFRLGLDSPFDNQWSKAFGIDLLQPGEIALRAAETYAIDRPDESDNPFQRVFVRPHADGITDLNYVNFNDWKVMSSGLCRSLATVQTPTMRVVCPPASW